ncbi:MAG: hypothetical protein IIB68_12445 [Proteobacteria bacterium]|nr:hypothetical protein [Pseudomonadota bacterium]
MIMSMRMPEELIHFYSELKRRKVIRVGMFYAIAAFALLQIGDVAFEPLEMPTWVLRTLIYAIIFGFPFTLVVAWFFDLTRHGLKRDPYDLQATGEYTTYAPATQFGNMPSIAVLPFTDMSEAQDQGYFCDGVAEAILNALTRVENLQVASRTSSFRFRGASDDIREIIKGDRFIFSPAIGQSAGNRG